MSDFVLDENKAKVEAIPFDRDMMALFNRIIDQNAQIIELNHRILNAFEVPRFHPIAQNTTSFKDLIFSRDEASHLVLS